MRMGKSTIYLILMLLILVGGGLYIYFVMGEVLRNIFKGL